MNYIHHIYCPLHGFVHTYTHLPSSLTCIHGYLSLHIHGHLSLYIHAHTIAGPFLISTTIKKIPVYWKVEQETIKGTKAVPDASLFYFMPFEDGTFAIAYWGDKIQDRKLLTNVENDLSKLRPMAPILPLFVTASNSTLGYSHGPLLLKQTFPMKNAIFTLYSRLQSSFACFTSVSNPADILIWMEGDEYFIKHETFLKKEFVSMSHDIKTGTYNTLMQSRAKEIHNPQVGMLFRLHPHMLQIVQQSTSSENASKPHAKTVEVNN